MNIALLVLALVAQQPDTHQPPAIIPRRGIAWGALVPGVETSVDPRDASRRGEIDVINARGSELLVSLPTHLVSQRGDKLPVTFRQGEMLVVDEATGTVSAPDPSGPVMVNTRGESNKVTLFLGGTVRPTLAQPPGDYHAVITVATRVTMSPNALYISSRQRAAAFDLYNSGDEAAEVEFSLAFGYPVSDSLGNVDVPLAAVAPEGEPSALDWLRIYPRRLILEPGQRRVVRVAAYPPAMPAGEYWARLLVRTRAAPPPLKLRETQEQRGTMSLETLFVTAVNYRNGRVETGLEVERALAVRTDSIVMLALDLKRTGNAAYLGHLEVELRSARGTLLDRWTEDIAVYRTLRRIVPLKAPESKRAEVAEVRYRIATERDNMGSEVLIRGPTREGRVALVQ